MPVSVLLAVILLVSLLASHPASAAWPPDWPFLRAEEGWFFYHEPRSRPEPPQPDQPEAPEPREPPAPEIPVEPQPAPPETPATEEDGRSASGTLTFSMHAPAELPPAPLSGPRLEAWLLAISDRDLERLVTTAPASALRAWSPILLDQALTVLDRPSVRKYLLVQRESLRRSERFSTLWQEVVWTDPTFDRPGTIPTGSLAQAIWQEERGLRRAATLASLRDRVSLLLVVGPDCKACEAQWTILSRWSAHSGIAVRPIARELVTLSDSSLAMPYPRVIDRLEVTELPTLYLVEPATGFLTRLGSGLLAEEELTTRLLALTAPDPRQQKGDLRHVALTPDE